MYRAWILFASICMWSFISAQHDDDIFATSENEIFAADHDNEFPMSEDNEFSVSHDNEFPMSDDNEFYVSHDNEFAASHCPLPELIAPCTCSETYEVMVKCKDLTSHDDLRTIFGRVRGFTFTILYVTDSTMLYFPSSTLLDANVRDINVTDCTFVSLFDEPPTSTHLRNIYIDGAVFQRGFRWEMLSQLNLDGLGLNRTTLKKLGSKFKQNVPKGIKYLWLKGNDLSRLTGEPFENLESLEILMMENQKFPSFEALKFPKNMAILSLQGNKLQTLPDNMFEDLPNLRMVLLGNNSFTTFKEEFFSRANLFALQDNPFDCSCDLKWILNSKYASRIFSGTCASPINLKGKELRKLTADDFNYCG